MHTIKCAKLSMNCGIMCTYTLSGTMVILCCSVAECPVPTEYASVVALLGPLLDARLVMLLLRPFLSVFFLFASDMIFKWPHRSQKFLRTNGPKSIPMTNWGMVHSNVTDDVISSASNTSAEMGVMMQLV